MREYQQERKVSRKKKILGPAMERKFILIMDVLTHYLYAREIEGNVNKINLEKSFTDLFNLGLPKFMVINKDIIFLLDRKAYSILIF